MTSAVGCLQYVDLRKAFDSVNRDVLRKILALRRILPKVDNIIYGLYSGRAL